MLVVLVNGYVLIRPPPLVSNIIYTYVLLLTNVVTGFDLMSYLFWELLMEVCHIN